MWPSRMTSAWYSTASSSPCGENWPLRRMLVDALSLEFVEPFIQRLLAKAAVAAQLDVGNAAGARLRPHPVLRHAQALGASRRGVSRDRLGEPSRDRESPGGAGLSWGLALKHESRLARGGFRIAGAGFEPATFGL
jgi:hypothetical protein